MNTIIIDINQSSKNYYQFSTCWHVEATCAEVYRTLETAEDLPRWWPSVYLDAKQLEKGQTGGVGKVVALYTKGFLPYTLKWKFRVTHTQFPHGFALEAIGDFAGKGVWTFTQITDKQCEVVYDWKIKAEKPLLKKLSWLLKPLFSANHRWAMRKGEESLKLELQRRGAASKEEREAVHKPPGPVFPHNFLNNKVL